MTESNFSIDFSYPSALNLLAVTSLRKNLGVSLEVIVFWDENNETLCAHHDVKVSNESRAKRKALLNSFCTSKRL